MKKDDVLILRINGEVKKVAMEVAESNGISISALVNFYLSQIAKTGKIPYFTIERTKALEKEEENKQNAIELIRKIRANLSQSSVYEKIDKLYLFGSYARGEETQDSDVDLFVEFNDDASLLDHSKLHVEIEDLLDRKVDLVTSEKDDPFLELIKKDQILIYERN